MEYEIWNTDKWNMKYGIPINKINNKNLCYLSTKHGDTNID
jgi:hypothetical protein